MPALFRGAGFAGPLRRWRGRGLKLEAAAFLLLLLTFAAVIWEDSLRETRLTLTGSSLQFQPYTYSDANDGGASSVTTHPDHMLRWTCTLRAHVEFPYCGYGMEYQAAPNKPDSLDLSRYDSVALSILYRGPPAQLKLTLKNFDPAYSRQGHGNSTMPVVAEFAVKPGMNAITLQSSDFRVDQWWLDSHSLPPALSAPDLRHIVAIDIVSGGGTSNGSFSVDVKELTFTGILLSSAQWYLLILAGWLMLTGAYLVYRFLSVSRGYEMRERRQSRESRELADARAAAVAASTAKSQFLANMSHELRTPLNAILGYAQLLERSDLSERERAAVSTIHQSGSHLLTLITDILDLSKIEAGKLDLLPGPFNIAQCVAQVSDMIRLRAEEKGLRFDLQLSPDLPANVVGDAKRVRQILLNLLSNAVKFTDTGGVTLEVSVASWGGGDVRLRMDVIDTGTGILPSQMERLFQPFEQAGSAEDRSGGTGLGLSIARQLVRAMNGDIEVQSTPGAGTRFRVEIECALASGASLLQQQSPPPPRPVSVGPVEPAAPELVPSDAAALLPPSDEWLDRLLVFARAGNMRAIRQQAERLAASEPHHRPFAERLGALAASYQSPSVLRLIEESIDRKDAA